MPTDDKQITETTYEVTVREFVGDGDPSVTGDEIVSTLGQLSDRGHDIELITAMQI